MINHREKRRHQGNWTDDTAQLELVRIYLVSKQLKKYSGFGLCGRVCENHGDHVGHPEMVERKSA